LLQYVWVGRVRRERPDARRRERKMDGHLTILGHVEHFMGTNPPGYQCRQAQEQKGPRALATLRIVFECGRPTVPR